MGGRLASLRDSCSATGGHLAELRLREPALGWRGTPGGQNDGLKSRARDSVVQRQAISILLIFLLFFGFAVLLQWLGVHTQRTWPASTNRHTM